MLPILPAIARIVRSCSRRPPVGAAGIRPVIQSAAVILGVAAATALLPNATSAAKPLRFGQAIDQALESRGESWHLSLPAGGTAGFDAVAPGRANEEGGSAPLAFGGAIQRAVRRRPLSSIFAPFGGNQGRPTR